MIELTCITVFTPITDFKLSPLATRFAKDMNNIFPRFSNFIPIFLEHVPINY